MQCLEVYLDHPVFGGHWETWSLGWWSEYCITPSRETIKSGCESRQTCNQDLRLVRARSKLAWVADWLTYHVWIWMQCWQCCYVKHIVAKFKDVRTRWNLAESSEEGFFKKGHCANDDGVCEYDCDECVSSWSFRNILCCRLSHLWMRHLWSKSRMWHSTLSVLEVLVLVLPRTNV